MLRAFKTQKLIKNWIAYANEVNIVEKDSDSGNFCYRIRHLNFCGRRSISWQCPHTLNPSILLNLFSWCSCISSKTSLVLKAYWQLFFGSYALHTDPIVRGNLVSVTVCHFVTLRTRRHVTRKLLAGRLGTSNSKLFRRPLLLPSCCCGCVLNCSRFLCVGKILKSFPSQISSICSR